MSISWASVQLRQGVAGLRDFQRDDMKHIVHYFYAGYNSDLDHIIDRRRLPGPERTRGFFFRTIRTGNPDQRVTTFAITLDGRFSGFTTLHRETAAVNYSHWHLTCRDARSLGISTALYPHRIQLFFDLYPIERVIHRTSVANHSMNRVLDKFIPVAERQRIDEPDGLMVPGDYYIRYVSRGDLPGIIAGSLSRAAEGGD